MKVFVLAKARTGRTMLAATRRNGLARIVAFETRASAESANVPGFTGYPLTIREVDLEQLGTDVGATRFAVDVCDVGRDGDVRVVTGIIAKLAGSSESQTEHLRHKFERDLALDGDE